ncbi:hypothetical protein PIIN_03079 [Serendipita indica DSM 11827]|uniref:Uncharacterized protein n=1 Tax=Serendipita indica (strain DSM 11827) TaxID=1109443 RepID=G4TCX6_SERID|nr:hypothetical protein PIIN_03079 [Serendipita indica DSM 11827]
MASRDNQTSTTRRNSRPAFAVFEDAATPHEGEPRPLKKRRIEDSSVEMDISPPSSTLPSIAPSLKNRSAFSGLSLQLQSTPPNKEKLPRVMEFSSLTAHNLNTTFLDASSLLRPRRTKVSPIIAGSLKTSLVLNSPFRSTSRCSQNHEPSHTPNTSKRRPSEATSRRTPLTPKGNRRHSEARDSSTRRRSSSIYMRNLADIPRSKKKQLAREQSLIEALHRSTFTSPPRRAPVDTTSPSIFQDASQMPPRIPHINSSEGTPSRTNARLVFMPDFSHVPQPDDEADLFSAPPTPQRDASSAKYTG